MLEMIRTIDDPSVAYAFVDEGCYGEKGLDSVRSGMKKEAILFYLDLLGQIHRYSFREIIFQIKNSG